MNTDIAKMRPGINANGKTIDLSAKGNNIAGLTSIISNDIDSIHENKTSDT
jgi:hypothetical protein